MQTFQNPDVRLGRPPHLVICFVEALLLAVPAFARAPSTPGEADTPENFVRQLESRYAGVRTLRAEFTQSFTWGGRTRSESGTVSFARGGRMRWDYREPKEKLFLSDGRKVFLYIPSEKQLTRSSVKTSDDVRVPFLLLLSHPNLRRVFSRIEFADQALRHEPESRVLRAFPKGGAEEGYSEVLMEVGPAFDLRRLVVNYPDRSVMVFTFRSLQKNVTLSPLLFRFTPPPGTEIIDQ